MTDLSTSCNQPTRRRSQRSAPAGPHSSARRAAAAKLRTSRL